MLDLGLDERYAEAREKHSNSLSIAVGIVQHSVATWESGRCVPNIPSLIWISEHFEIAADLQLGLTKQDKFSDGITYKHVGTTFFLLAKLPFEIQKGVLRLIRLTIIHE